MRILAVIGALAILVAIGSAIFLFGGYFNVAASAPDPGLVNWTVARVRMASIDRRARFSSTLNLDDLETVRRRAGILSAGVLELSRRARRELAEVFGSIESGSP